MLNVFRAWSRLVRDIVTDNPVAIHRTALKLSAIRSRKSTAGHLGPVAGGAIKINADDDVTHGLMIGEGIETVLSARSKTISYRLVGR